jgi:LVIVD repeat-containing protein
MTRSIRLLAVVAAFLALAIPAVASAAHEGDPRTTNLVPLGHLPEPLLPSGNFNSDIAFWRNYAIEGAYDSFRIIDISNSSAPVEVSDTLCGWSQGDITISPDGNVLVRSQDSPRQLPGNDPNQACADTGAGTLANGWEGLQIFDISNKAAPRFIKAVFTDFGSHTHTQYYDRANNRLIIYVSRSGSREGAGGYSAATPNPYGGQNWPATNGCITAVEVPLANPAGAAVVNRCIVAGESPVSVTAGGCHDVAVYEGMRLLYGACRPNMILWDISDPVNPRKLHEQQYPGITGWHSAAMSWDGKYLFAGWEPGGGSQPRCQPTGATQTNLDMSGNPTSVGAPVQTDAMKTIFVFRRSDGVLVGRWVLPQEQSQFENCTIHNYALAPYVDKYILVGDAYQAGNYVIDFTRSLNGDQVAFSDPPAYDANPAAPGTQTGLVGEWSTHWYNDLIYASDIAEGVNIWDLNERWWETHSVNLRYLNPQTMTERLTCRVRAHGALRARQRGQIHVRVRVNGQRIAGMTVNLRGAGLRASRVTRASGDVMLRAKPSRAGTLRVSARALNVARCATTRRVAQPRGGVTGATAGGGVALTGRPA